MPRVNVSPATRDYLAGLALMGLFALVVVTAMAAASPMWGRQ